MRVALIVALAAWTIAGCTSTGSTPRTAAGTPPPARTQSRPPSATPEPTHEGARSWRRNRACVDSHKFSGSAPAYEGDGPHMIAEQTFHGGYLAYVPDEIFTKGYFPRQDDAVVNDGGLPGNWEPGPPKDADPKGPPYAQLVLCHTATPAARGENIPARHRVGTCRFDTVIGRQPSNRKTYPVVRATHHFAVYVARTGRLITSFDLKGATASTARTCPVHAIVDEETVVARPPSKQALIDRLRTLHDGAAR